MDFLRYFDLLIPSVALAQGFGRIGCFFAGCCYGREAHGGEWGVVFPSTGLAPSGVALVPTQIYSAIGDFAIFFILIAIAGYNKKSGKGFEGLIAGLYIIFYSAGRFAVEFLRDDPRGAVGTLSTSQFIAIFIAALGVAILIVQNRRDKKAVEETI